MLPIQVGPLVALGRDMLTDDICSQTEIVESEVKRAFARTQFRLDFDTESNADIVEIQQRIDELKLILARKRLASLMGGNGSTPSWVTEIVCSIRA